MKETQQDVEHGDQVSQMGLDIGSQPMKELLGTTHDRNHREGSLYQHPFIPGALGTQLEIGWNAILAPKAQIREADGLTLSDFDQGIKLLIGAVQGRPRPARHLTVLIEEPAQLDPHRPATFILVFLADLLRAAPLPDRKDQFDRKAVDHRKEAQVGQQPITPVVVGFQQPFQTGALWQAAEQGIIVALQPAIEGPKMASLQSKQVTSSLG